MLKARSILKALKVSVFPILTMFLVSCAENSNDRQDNKIENSTTEQVLSDNLPDCNATGKLLDIKEIVIEGYDGDREEKVATIQYEFDGGVATGDISITDAQCESFRNSGKVGSEIELNIDDQGEARLCK